VAEPGIGNSESPGRLPWARAAMAGAQFYCVESACRITRDRLGLSISPGWSRARLARLLLL
jgi:hypothetical protein